MAYTVKNYSSKKELIEDFKAGKKIEVYQPNADVTGYELKDGRIYLEGPHYPKPHKWYAAGWCEGGILTGLKG
jgi:hypothetical protein